MKIKCLPLALIVLLIYTCFAARAQTLLGGRPGISMDYNATWLDLQIPTKLLRGSTLEFAFIGGQLNEIVVGLCRRDVPTLHHA